MHGRYLFEVHLLLPMTHPMMRFAFMGSPRHIASGDTIRMDGQWRMRQGEG